MAGSSVARKKRRLDTASGHEKCKLHASRAASKCNATTYSGTLCTRAAKIFRDGYLPLCNTHRREHFEEAGRCQAIESCGQPCLRLSRCDPPYHLCTVHEHGTDTLPCHLLALPVELRLMIYRYILPSEIKACQEWRYMYWKRNPWVDRLHSPVNRSLLILNRKIYEEASSLLYKETTFHATIGVERIELLGKRCDWNPKNLDNPFSNLTDAFHKWPVKQLRNLHITVYCDDVWGGMNGKPNNTRPEEFMLVTMRNTIRKFVRLVADATPKRLQLRLDLQPRMGWNLEQAIAAICLIMEPFEGLPCNQAELLNARVLLNAPPRTRYLLMGVNREGSDTELNLNDHIELQQTWPKDVCNSESRMAVQSEALFHRQEHARSLLYSIEDVAGRVLERGLTKSSKRDLTDSFELPSIESLLYQARLAFEYVDVKALKEMRDALVQRLVNDHRDEHREWASTADVIGKMYALDDKPQDLAHKFPDTFGPSIHTVVPEQKEIHWPEFNPENGLADLEDENITSWQDRERLYFRKGRNTWTRLRFPSRLEGSKKS